MIDQSLEESEKKRDSQVADLAERTVIDALEICAVEREHGAGQSVAFLAIWSIISNVLDQEIVTGQKQNADIKAVVHLMMLQVVTDVFL